MADSDPKKAIWMAFPVKDDGTLGAGKVFFILHPKDEICPGDFSLLSR